MGGKSGSGKGKRERIGFTAYFKSFGNFELIADDEPPIIMEAFMIMLILQKL